MSEFIKNVIKEKTNELRERKNLNILFTAHFSSSPPGEQNIYIPIKHLLFHDPEKETCNMYERL